MKICYIITTLVHGGAERLLVNLSNSLARRHAIHIIYLKGEPLLRETLDPSIILHHVPLGPACVFRLRTLVKSIGPDLVHTHLGHADLLGMVAIAGLKVTRFCGMHNIWFKFNWIDKPIFSIYGLIFRTIARDCQVIAISKSVEAHVRRLGVPAQRIHLLMNAVRIPKVEESREALRSRLGIPADSFCVLFVGRLAPQKSAHTLLEAVSRVRTSIPNLILLMVGEGELRGEFQALSGRLNLGDTVQFRGAVHHPEFFYHAADIFVLPSVFEGLGMVILEAFGASLPVIATDIEGPGELVQHGRNGLLFKPGDVARLTELIQDLHADAGMRARLGKAGNESLREDFDVEKYAARMEELYLRPPGGRGA
jgi:glycosyltransferase involved in cell wall biosynthesis